MPPKEGRRSPLEPNRLHHRSASLTGPLTWCRQAPPCFPDLSRNRTHDLAAVASALNNHLRKALIGEHLQRSLGPIYHRYIINLLRQPAESADYACGNCTGLVIDCSIQISMSRKGNPYDNTRTESFTESLKYEEVFRQKYRDLAEAGRSLNKTTGESNFEYSRCLASRSSTTHDEFS